MHVYGWHAFAGNTVAKAKAEPDQTNAEPKAAGTQPVANPQDGPCNPFMFLV